MSQTLTLIQPDDWHIHLRDQEALQLTVADASKQFARAIVMPNLVPPVTKAEHAIAYKERILAATPKAQNFTPLMVLYLTEQTTVEDIRQAKVAGIIGCKLYPAGATTNSASGVRDVESIYPVLEAMEDCGLVLQVHGEVTDSSIDIFDREAVFIERTLTPLVERFPNLKIVLEHITTQNAAEFVTHAPDNVGATITAHHLLYNRNHMLVGGIRPHLYCLPILKRNVHQQALIQAATSGNPKFFLGTDSAPHTKERKEAACGCAGAYTAHAAIELYAQAFEGASALDKLEGFASIYGPNFYDLPINSQTITLNKHPWQVPGSYSYAGATLTPLCANETLQWKLTPTQE